MDWIKIQIFTNTEGVEVLTGILMELGIDGFVVCDPNDFEDFLQGKSGYWDLIDDDLMKLKNDETHIELYLKNDAKDKETFNMLKERINALKQSGADFGRLDILLSDVAQEDWENGWKKYYRPLRIGEHILIKPSWEDIKDEQTDGDYVIELDPGMAFGTGTHETTKMCTQLIEKYVKSGMDVLDVGSGSGILSIVAAKLGAKSVTAVDIDEKSVEVAKENILKNGVDGIVNAYPSDLLKSVSGDYDIVIANIIADVIINLSSQIRPYIREGGLFITSGIINLRYEDVIEAFDKNGFEIVEKKRDGDWMAFVLK